ncbi:unnamed protein product [Amoebophrya sp. A25]|nr:unnamed protein product [Amoebophrya sp. A25]|eukprot:GSA25T00013371001.1
MSDEIPESSLPDDEAAAVTLAPWLNFPCELAEECAKETLDEIVAEGGSKIHFHRLAEKSTPFAAKAVTKSILSHVGMCFVKHESLVDDTFHLEKIPPIVPNPSDFWGRMIRPVMPVDEHERRLREQNHPPGSPSNATAKSSPGGRSKKSAGDKSSIDASPKHDDRDRKTKIVEEAHEDDEENKYRQVKEREEKAKTDAIQKAADEKKAGEEQKRRADRLLEQMTQQSWTFDTSGRLMWVEQMDGNKLPKVISEITSKGEAVGKKSAKKTSNDDSPSPDNKSQKSPKSRSPGGGKKKDKKPQFTDGFTRLQSEQPPITETMSVRAGVTLMAKGQMRKGAPKDDERMSRAKYAQFLEAEQSGNATGFAFGATLPGTKTPSELPPLEVSPADLPKMTAGSVASSARGSEAGGAGAGDAGFPLSAPQTTKDWRLKRDAIGNLGRFPRHHVNTLGTAASGGFARCLPQPMLGATMGHGLQRDQSFFFPDTLTTNEFDRTMSRASTTGKSFYQTHRSETTPWGEVMDRERRHVVNSIRKLDIRSNMRSGGGRMQTREKGRQILQKAMGTTQ